MAELRRGLGQRGLPLPGGGRARSLARSRTGLSPRSTPLSARVGRRLHHRDITSIQALIGRPQLQVCAIGLHCNKARPGLLPLQLTSRLRRVALSGPGGRAELVPERAAGSLPFTATPPHAGARTLTRAHFLDSAFAPESGLGFSPAHLAGRLFLSARPSACARGPPSCVSLWRTPSLCHLRPGSPVRHTPDTHSSLLRAGARHTPQTQSPPLSLLRRPLPSPSVHTWTHHTHRVPAFLHARSFPSTQATKCAWEHHCACP